MEDEELHFGPNGGLIFCVEYLLENADWLHDRIGKNRTLLSIFTFLYQHFRRARRRLFAIRLPWTNRTLYTFTDSTETCQSSPIVEF